MQLFTPVRMSAGGRPIMGDDEIELLLASPSDLYEGKSKAMENGTAVITSKRLIYLHTKTGKNIGVDLGAFVRELSTETPFFGTAKVVFTLTNGSTVRLNFSDSGVRDNFYNQARNGLINARQSAPTAIAAPAPGSTPAPTPGTNGTPAYYGPPVPARPAVEATAPLGIAGILERRAAEQRQTDAALKEAFSDLKSLMANAQKAVQLADKLQSKTAAANAATAATTPTSGGSAAPAVGSDTLLEAVLSLGVASPVTKAGAGAAFHEQLARQLVDFFGPILPRIGGMVSLTDAYCLVARARGTELISPEDLLAACRLWAPLQLPLRLHTFPASGVIAVCAAAAGAETLGARVLARVREHTPPVGTLSRNNISSSGSGDGGSSAGAGDRTCAGSRGRAGMAAAEVAEALGVSLAIAKEQLRQLEGERALVRDEAEAAVRFYANVFW